MKIDIPESKVARAVIVGGGFGGLTIAKSLSKIGVQVILIDKDNYHTFQPLLYQVATCGLIAESIAFPIRKIFKNFKNFYFRMANVENINPEENIIQTSIGDLSYDYLVIATGSQTNYFGMEGLQINSMPMKTILEALDLRSMILQNFEKALGIENQRKKQALMNYVIAGGGPTGVELAGAFAELKKHILPKDYPELDISEMGIYLIQSGPRLLPSFSEKSSAKAKKYLETLGVNVQLNTRVVDYNVGYVQTNKEEDLIAKTLIWTTGVVGVPIDGINADTISKGKRILVDEYNRVKGYENIFAIGDVAAMVSENYPRGHPMVAPVAIQQGSLLAKNIGKMRDSKELVPFKYNDMGSLATIGKNKAVVEMGKFKVQGAIAWYIWMFVHLFSLIGFGNKVMVFFNWTANYFNSEKGARLILQPYEHDSVKRKRKKEMEDSKDAG